MDDVVAVFIIIIAANGAPILLRWLLDQRWCLPVDFGCRFFDNRPLFGSSKTWAGIGAVVMTAMALAPILQLELKVGFLVGVGVVIGDLLSSFVKRRLGMTVSSMAVGLDQVPEALFPYLLVMNVLSIPIWKIAIAVLSFLAFELLISRFLYWLNIRKQPY